MNTTPLIEWDAPEFFYHKKSNDWYWSIIISTLSITITSFIFKNYLFSFLVLIAGSAMCYFGTKRPDTIHCSIKNDGIRAKNIVFPFESIKYYDIQTNERESKILLLTNRTFMPLISIPAHEDMLSEINHILSEKIEHTELREPGIYKLLDMFGF